jgi:hypothetical protein
MGATGGEEMKLCKDCKHFESVRLFGFTFSPSNACLAKLKERINFVTGEITVYNKCNAHDMRRDSYYGCGPEGKLFEAKK